MDALLAGLASVAQPMVLLYLVSGLVLGAIFGALPGLTATMGVALLTPITFWLSAQEGMAMLLGIYCGAIPAGGIPAILLNIPGTPASIAAAWDGYPLARQGALGSPWESTRSLRSQAKRSAFSSWRLPHFPSPALASASDPPNTLPWRSLASA